MILFGFSILNTVLTQIRMVEGRVNFPSKGVNEGNMPLIWQRPFGVIPGAVSFFFFSFLFSITIFGDSVAYFFEIIMLISLKGTLTQTRTKLDRVTFPCKGPMRSRYVVIMVKF